jgi:hypothetical protein
VAVGTSPISKLPTLANQPASWLPYQRREPAHRYLKHITSFIKEGHMNNRSQLLQGLEDFFSSNERVLLVTGTHQYNKHKVVMAYIDKAFQNARIHFRTNGMDNLCNKDFLGFAGLKKKPNSGDLVRLSNNWYIFDSFNTRTWHNTLGNNNISLIYPVDAIIRNKSFNIIEEILDRTTQKIILISWTDHTNDDYEALSEVYDRCLVYDAEEENPEYHKRVLEL